MSSGLTASGSSLAARSARLHEPGGAHLPIARRRQRRVLGAQGEVRRQPADGQQQERGAGHDAERPRTRRDRRRGRSPGGSSRRRCRPGVSSRLVGRRRRSAGRSTTPAGGPRTAASPTIRALVRCPAVDRRRSSRTFPAGAPPRLHLRGPSPRRRLGLSPGRRSRGFLFIERARRPPLVRRPRRPIRDARQRRRRRPASRPPPCPSPSPTSMWTKKAITPACRPRAEGAEDPRRRENGLPTCRDHEQDHRGDEEREAHHAELTEHVEPLAVRVLDHTAVGPEAVVREGERACPCAGDPSYRDCRAASRQSAIRPFVVSTVRAVPPRCRLPESASVTRRGACP